MSYFSPKMVLTMGSTLSAFFAPFSAWVPHLAGVYRLVAVERSSVKQYQYLRQKRGEKEAKKRRKREPLSMLRFSTLTLEINATSKAPHGYYYAPIRSASRFRSDHGKAIRGPRAGDESVVTKAGKTTHGLDRFFSSLFGKPVPGLAFLAFS